MSTERPDVQAMLASLKTFQRRTVDYVFGRLFDPANPAKQFLVADEVGLGKTMVARGVVARTIDHLWDTTKRIDIVYICSNQVIAQQNIQRLNRFGDRSNDLPTRMTLVPLRLRGKVGLDKIRINFISLTPGTSFDLKNATGVAEERALLYRLLQKLDLFSTDTRLRNLLQVNLLDESWDGWIAATQLDDEKAGTVDNTIVDGFLRDVRADEVLFAKLVDTCNAFGYRRENYPPEMTKPRNEVIAGLRAKLARASVRSLEPDLIILDEFQRFKSLLHGNDEAAELARDLFEYSEEGGHGVRTLLLSATPYRMMTLAGDAKDEGDHYAEFLETVGFLYGKERKSEVVAALEREMRALREFLQRLPGSHDAAVGARREIERRLRSVIARTERVGNTVDRDSMVAQVPMPVSVDARDLVHAAAVAGVARALDAPDTTEYWKSAPNLLNFMRDYVLKRQLRAAASQPSPALLAALRRAEATLLDRERIARYEPIEFANGKLRALADDVFRDGLATALWLPPALPYYGEQPTCGSRPTKALVFSSWSMVPDAIAALLSYESERRMVDGATHVGYFDKKTQLLQFRHDSHGNAGNLRGMLLMYPSPCLAQIGDPLSVFADRSTPMTFGEAREAVKERLRDAVVGLDRHRTGDVVDTTWEWAAPVVLDAASPGVRAWLKNVDGLRALLDTEVLDTETVDSAAAKKSGGFSQHVAELLLAMDDNHRGLIPDNLLDLLVDVALGSPAICALRALRRVAPELGWDDATLLQSAAQIAEGFRTLFNHHDTAAVLRHDSDERYWQRVLSYCAEHHLQAVLDEYAHYLVDAEGLRDRTPTERSSGIAKAMAQALSILPSQISVDDPRVRGDDTIDINVFALRGRFAMRLSGNADADKAAERIGSVRSAFNSPFRPFVLATTAVGQEGLDFHPYCYRVYHWNLPGNPVDLEQREGRVHRFKGHAVRLNLAHRHGEQLRGTHGAAGSPFDPWQQMFDIARQETTIDSDLVPYWIYEGPVKVERHVPLLPFSRDQKRFEWLKRSLTIYRLAFGQPRQDDLLEYLHQLLDTAMSAEEIDELQISLEPPVVR